MLPGSVEGLGPGKRAPSASMKAAVNGLPSQMWNLQTSCHQCEFYRGGKVLGRILTILGKSSNSGRKKLQHASQQATITLHSSLFSNLCVEACCRLNADGLSVPSWNGKGMADRLQLFSDGCDASSEAEQQQRQGCRQQCLTTRAGS